MSETIYKRQRDDCFMLVQYVISTNISTRICLQIKGKVKRRHEVQ